MRKEYDAEHDRNRTDIMLRIILGWNRKPSFELCFRGFCATYPPIKSWRRIATTAYRLFKWIYLMNASELAVMDNFRANYMQRIQEITGNRKEVS